MHFTNPFYQFQATRTICPSIGSTHSEIHMIIGDIRQGDAQSWYQAWKNASELAQSEGACLKAAHYLRTAAFMLPDQAPQSLDAHRQARELFSQALSQEPHHVKRVSIPYETTTLPAYLGLIDDRVRPLIVLQSGFDGTAEEVYIVFGRAALQRGYNILIFEGPGQGAALREQNLKFRSDWEQVVKPVTDYTLSLPTTDPHHLALAGFSMGGYLVPRALAFEHRIPMGIVNGGVHDFHAVVMASGGIDLEPLLDIPEACEMIDDETCRMMEHDPAIRWAIEHGLFSFGAMTPSEWMRMTRTYHVRDCVESIQAKMLVIDSESDFQMKGQSRALYEALSCPKEFMLFTTAEGAGAHCQAGAYELSSHRILEWVDRQIS